MKKNYKNKNKKNKNQNTKRKEAIITKNNKMTKKN